MKLIRHARYLQLPMLLLMQFCSIRSSQNNSLRVNTHRKELSDTVMTLSSIQAAGNICTREEPYVEVIQVPEMQPVRVRTSSWCLDIPPRCSSYKTEMREVMRVERLNKTRTVRFCCQGYGGNLSDSYTSCKPICRGGCGRGICLAPDICSCEDGYIGKHCTQRCDHDRWGLDCKNVCQCQNDAVCDNKTGSCHCVAGWVGQYCKQPCPPGTFGVMCRKACECADKLCNPQTGECNWSDQSGAVNMSNVMLQTINSSMANLTHNINNIVKRIGSISEATHEHASPSPLPEVILIKQPVQEVSHTPKIILHESSNALIENFHSAVTAVVPATEVLHVITNTGSASQEHSPQLNLAGFAIGEINQNKSLKDHDSRLHSIVIIILLMLVIGLALSFLYVHRRHYLHKEPVIYNANGTFTSQAHFASHHNSNPDVISDSSTLGKIFRTPLPQPPATQTSKPSNEQSNEVTFLELYDSPSNNSSIRTLPYAYARKESLYSVVSPKSRKGSLDSHLYDEIRYHQQHHQHIQQHHPNTSDLHYQHSTTAGTFLPTPSTMLHQGNSQTNHESQHHQHISRSLRVFHLIISPQNSNFL